MTTEIYVTPTERAIFDSLPGQLRSGWQVHDEALTKYETDRQLQMRYYLADFTAYPEVKAAVTAMQQNPGSVGFDTIAEFNPELQEQLYFVLGARGLTVFIARLLQEQLDDDALFALSVLTPTRHKLLELNQSATHV